MTFTLRANNFKMDKGVKPMQAKEWENNKKADKLTVYKEEKKADYFSMNDGSGSEDCAEEITLYTSHYEPGTAKYTTFIGSFGMTKITLGWKLEAVRDHVQGEHEKMNDWLKDLNSDQSNAFQMAFIDLI